MRTTNYLFGALLIGMATFASAQERNKIEVTVDGKQVVFAGAEPMMERGRIMVPLRGVFEQMGAYVTWNESERTVKAENGPNVVILNVGGRDAMINGKSVDLDAPARMVQGRAMVPLRFIGEAFGADVEWVDSMSTVVILTDKKGSPIVSSPRPVGTMMRIDSGTVIPVRLKTDLSSDESRAGDKFSASVQTNNDDDYAGLPQGTVILGHVEVARAKTKNAPGVLGLAFDKVKMPDGKTYNLSGELIGLTTKDVETVDGRLQAKNYSKGNVKFVGIGAGAGALFALVTKGNILTDTLIGTALGYAYDELRRNPAKSNDVHLTSGTEFGVRLTKRLSFREIVTKN